MWAWRFEVICIPLLPRINLRIVFDDMPFVEFSMSLPLKSAATFWNLFANPDEPLARIPHEEKTSRQNSSL